MKLLSDEIDADWPTVIEGLLEMGELVTRILRFLAQMAKRFWR